MVPGSSEMCDVVLPGRRSEAFFICHQPKQNPAVSYPAGLAILTQTQASEVSSPWTVSS